MNKYQEALDYINGEAIQEITNSYFRKHKTLDGISFEEFDKNLTKIQGLVDKATPKKPNKDGECIVCGTLSERYLAFDSKRYAESFNWKYCANCGQALDWSKDDNPHR